MRTGVWLSSCFSLNPDPAPRIGTISVGGKTYTVLQQGRP
jgi:hypothetical protein